MSKGTKALTRTIAEQQELIDRLRESVSMFRSMACVPEDDPDYEDDDPDYEDDYPNWAWKQIAEERRCALKIEKERVQRLQALLAGPNGTLMTYDKLKDALQRSEAKVAELWARVCELEGGDGSDVRAT